MKRSLIFLSAIFSLIAVVAGVTGFSLWFPKLWRAALVVESPMAWADTLIVLGGESQARPVEAVRLFHEGVAPRIFIIGTGDYPTNRRALLRGGVPAERISGEQKSKSTLENALFAKPLLEEAGIRRALIVTSSFHARRALATFQQTIPSVTFGVTTSRIGWWDTPPGRTQEDSWAAIELVKIVGYWIFHGITPWVAPVQPEA